MTSSTDTSSWKVFRRLLRYIRPHKMVFLLAVLGMALDGASQVIFAWMMQPLLDGTFIDKNPDIIRWLPPAIVGLFLMRGLATFVYRYGVSWVTRKVVSKIREEVFRHYLLLPTRHYDESTSGKMISRLTFDPEQLALSGGEAATISIRDSLAIIGLLGFMFYISPLLTSVIMILVPVIAIVVSYISRRFRKINLRIQKSMGDLTRVVEETVNGQKVVKIFCGEEYEKQRFALANEDNRKLNQKIVATSAGSNMIIQIVAASALAVIVWVAGSAAHKGDFSPGTFMSFMTAMLMILPALKKLTNVVSLLQKGLAASESLFEVLDSVPEPDAPASKHQVKNGHVLYENVDLVYDRSPDLVLKQVSFEARPGTVTALVGRSGSGKTSLVNLLPRFYLHAGGRILVDNVPVEDYSLKSLRAGISLVSQDVILFNDSIARNIAYGSLAECSMDDIVKAAKMANAHEFIESFNDGYDTQVGDRGVLLSGGQRQRIAIARAMLNNAPILILDEATSALDTESEKLIQEALERIMTQRTTLVIAHRLSTVEKADQILVLDKGQIVEQGSHASLLDENGLYAQLYRTQLDG